MINQLAYPPHCCAAGELWHAGRFNRTSIRWSKAAIGHLQVDIAIVHAVPHIHYLNDQVAIDGGRRHSVAQSSTGGDVAVRCHAEVDAVSCLSKVLSFPGSISRAANAPIDALVGHACSTRCDRSISDDSTLAIEEIRLRIVCAEAAECRVECRGRCRAVRRLDGGRSGRDVAHRWHFVDSRIAISPAGDHG